MSGLPVYIRAQLRASTRILALELAGGATLRQKPESDLFHALARLISRQPRMLLLVALAFVVGSVVLGGGVADRLLAGQGTENPASDSSRADDLLEEHFPESRPNLLLLVSSDRGVDDQRIAAQGVRLAERLAYEPGVTGVTSYWQTGAEDLKSENGRYALIAAHVAGTEDEASRMGAELAPEYTGRHGDLDVRVGGMTAVLSDVETTIAEDLAASELIALPLVLIILVLVFGSVVAASLPLMVGIIAITGTNGVLWLLAGVTDVSMFAQNITTMLGLGLAIDYALLMVRRYRDELRRGLDPRAAVAATLRTAGRTVLFSAVTVSVALSAMLLFPLYFLRSLAYAGISVVLLAAVAALVVLPASLVLLGHRVNALDVRRAVRRRRRESRRFPALIATVMRGAPVFALGSVVILVVLGLPFQRVEFGMADDRQLPADAESHMVQQVLRDQFDNSVTGTIDVVAPTPAGAELADYATRLSTVAGVEEVRTSMGTFAGGRQSKRRITVDAVRDEAGLNHLQILPDDGIEDISPESQALVRQIRAVPSPFPGTLVSGQSAAVVDTQEAIGDRLGWALALIVVSTLVLVFLLTGSVLVPVQVVVLNALSLTAMFGAVVWVFQDGNLSDLIGFTPVGFIDTSLPVLMFCMAFGLSMDYGVFLLSRIKEEHDRTGDNETAVAAGVRNTGGIITAAAVLLAVVLVAIGTSRVTNSMMLGWGVALAVLVDATVVRCLLVPAVMKLSGNANWWAPSWLYRFQQRYGLREGESTPAATVTEKTTVDTLAPN
ncbi:MMPL family transporter [Saccharopolyspora sp. ASAGF58]|uniref:MMPL family transporter n=1 Tax=Saccharopolyspora sp. ASAGF58 TaxID=2719023 RepID=UPI001B310584|nr:MMPL family transporter [Saccharopolyspora sp. ASAGF58]